MAGRIPFWRARGHPEGEVGDSVLRATIPAQGGLSTVDSEVILFRLPSAAEVHSLASPPCIRTRTGRPQCSWGVSGRPVADGGDRVLLPIGLLTARMAMLELGQGWPRFTPVISIETGCEPVAGRFVRCPWNSAVASWRFGQ